jgi:hypothetical protein
MLYPAKSDKAAVQDRFTRETRREKTATDLRADLQDQNKAKQVYPLQICEDP